MILQHRFNRTKQNTSADHESAPSPFVAMCQICVLSVLLWHFFMCRLERFHRFKWSCLSLAVGTHTTSDWVHGVSPIGESFAWRIFNQPGSWQNSRSWVVKIIFVTRLIRTYTGGIRSRRWCVHTFWLLALCALTALCYFGQFLWRWCRFKCDMARVYLWRDESTFLSG